MCKPAFCLLDYETPVFLLCTSFEFMKNKRRQVSVGSLRFSDPGMLQPLHSHTAPLGKHFKIDGNGARVFMGHFLCGVETLKRFVDIH